MKIHFRFVMLAIAAYGLTTLFAQAQTSSADSTVLNPLARKIQSYINQNQVDSLYAMVNDRFKKERSLERVKSETKRMRNDWGQWKSIEFKEIKNGVAHYIATFEKETLNFYLGLDKAGKANTIFFSYKERK